MGEAAVYLTQCLHRGVIHHPEKTATIFGDRRLTYKEFRDQVSLVAGMLNRLGVQRGDRVTILALNSDTYLQFYYGVLWLGAIVNPANTRWSRAEVVYSLNDCTPNILVVDEHFRSMMEGVQKEAPSIKHVIYLGESSPSDDMLALAVELKRSSPIPDAFAGYETPAAIYYTGGTTGFPKGVLLSHTSLMAAAASRLSLGFVPGPKYLHAAPIFHLAGALGVSWQFLSGGTHVVLPTFDPVKVMETIEREKITDTLLVPTMIQMIIQHPDIGKYDLSSLQTLVYGASPISETLLDAALNLFPTLNFIQGYGMTEVSGAIVFLPPYYHKREGRKENKLGSAGRISIFTELKIVDDAGHEAPRGVVGEIAMRGPTNMLGYWGRKDETDAILRDGWVYSGDGAYMDDDGYIYIVDRVKDMIVSGGENVYSAEVENAIAKHPAVASCAVVGIPSEKWGESVHAVVVPKPGATLTEQELINHCKTLIAGYKCPRSVEFRSELPLSGAGKIQKAQIRAPFWDGRKRQVG